MTWSDEDLLSEKDEDDELVSNYIIFTSKIVEVLTNSETDNDNEEEST